MFDATAFPRLLVVDGPEKAGKSTFIKAIEYQIEKEFGPNLVFKRHFNKPRPVFSEHDKFLLEDITLQHEYPFVIYDRSWLSEYVYSTLLDRKSDSSFNAVIGFESIWKPTLDKHAVRVIMLGDSWETLEKRRDNTDLPVSPKQERNMFRLLASWLDWKVTLNVSLESAFYKEIWKALVAPFSNSADI